MASSALQVEQPATTIDDKRISELFERFANAILEDINTAQALTALEDLLAMKKVDAGQKVLALAQMDNVLGLALLTTKRADLRVRPKSAVITEVEIEAALITRKEARAAKDFARSDAIRDELIAKGVEVMDGDPLGWDWKLDV
jgi:cysteinyl-tRNA synthetase